MFSSDEVTGDTRELETLCRKLLNRSIVNRTIPKQECMVMLGRLSLVESTETIEAVSLSGSFKVQATEQSDVLSQYKRSNSFKNNVSLYQYFMKKKEGRNIIPHFIGGSGQPCYPVSESYARHILLVHKPWCPRNLDEIEKDVISKFIVFLNSSECPSCVKISYERVKARYESKLTHHETIASSIDNTDDLGEDDNLDATTKDILASIGSLSAKAGDLVETENGYKFERGITFSWENTIHDVSYNW